MAKKTKDTTASTAKKEAKAKAPADPVTTKNLIRLLNILALLLAITAFLLQFFAVISHHWKYQETALHPLLSSNDNTQAQPSRYDDESRIDQRYGLFSRHVKVHANHDEQLNLLASTRFPRLDEGEEKLHDCLSRSTTLRSALLTCSKQMKSMGDCHCRRYPHWNAVIFFEIAALILLGLVVAVAALLTTQFHALLKLVGVALSFLAFLFLLIGLILILSYLKRETRTIADIYPHVHQRLSHAVRYNPQHYSSILQRVVRRQTAHETYRAYSLLPGQHPWNDTHFQEYSQEESAWVYKPYTSLANVAYAPRAQESGSTAEPTTAQTPAYSVYGPVVGYDQVYANTHACIGWSTVLSILAMILALLVPLLLAFSWLKAKSLAPQTKTVTTTTVRTEYVPVPQDVTVETVPLTRPIPTEYDPHRPIGEAVVTTHSAVGPQTAVTTREDQSAITTTQRS